MLVVLAAALVAADTGSTYEGASGNTRVALPRLEAAVTVDGILDDAAWRNAARLTGFSQYAPVDGRRAELETEVLVWYSPVALHFGVRAKAPPGSVRATLANRDRLTSEDRIEFYLGTYNDGHQALVFSVNPLGVQQDGTLAEQGRQNTGGREATDLSPDFVYESRGRLTDYGFEVEIRIPFKTLRYQSADPQHWGLHIVRRVESTGHEYSWVPARRASPTFLGQSGTLLGLTNLRRGLVMDLNPVVTARAAGAPEPSNPADWRYARTAELGGNLRWGLTPNLTFNSTFNPDFSQVEADASQIVTDPRRALFFAEKRPFFLEGIEQFSTPNQLIYSRRIAAPAAAAKLTGKVSGTTVATMLALDGSEVSRSGDDHPFFAIARVQRDLGGGSRAGLVFTNRSEPGFSNQVGGVDTRVVLPGGLALSAQVAGSRTERDGQSELAPLWELDARRAGRHFGFNATFEGVGDAFVAGAGFISQPDAVTLGASPSWTVYGRAGALIARATGSVRVNGRWIYDDFVAGRDLLDQQLFLTGNIEFRGGWSLNLFSWFERFGYDHRLYGAYALERHLPGGVVDTIAPYPGSGTVPNRGIDAKLQTPSVGPFNANLNVTYGNDVNYDEWSPATILFVNSSLQFKPTTQFRVDGTYILTSYRRKTDGSLVSISHIPRVKVEYQVTRAIFLRLVGEYRSLHRDSLRDDGRTNDPILIFDPGDGQYQRSLALAQAIDGLRGDFLFSYQPTPGTVFFAGYGGSFRDDGRFRFANLSRTADGFFIKASYLIRL
ncbi:MAG TPA: DUF5916 domain-containing protein [Gemmatimonadales bacterium]|nr:DUF5916 domain-containing protein [Gemmatimonadales bacterium]